MRKILLLGICLYSVVNYSQTIALQQFATGFTAAIEIAHPPNDSRLFVVQQGGLIRILNPNGTVNATPFLNLSALTSASGEQGLLGLAFHPNYATNGLFYVNYTNPSGNTVIARYGVSADPNIANTTATILMTISQPNTNHNGGTLKFGPDGYLYIGMGDGGGSGDTSGYAQNLSLTYAPVVSNPSRIYLGKMLRIDVDTTQGSLNYGIPPTNPFASEVGKAEIWAYGLRNPWKFSFNRSNGDLWIADVGQGSVEEIDKITSPLPNTGLNFGWRCFEGDAVYSNTIGPCPAYSATVPRFAQFSSAGATVRCSVTGGYFYTGSSYPNFQNKYFFADYCSAEIGTVDSAGTINWAYTPATDLYLSSLGEDMNGELYAITSTQYSATTPSIIHKLFDPTFGVSDFQKNGFSLYPNPANETVFIKSTTSLLASKIELFDLTGKLLLTERANGQENSLSVSDFAKGMYILTVETTNGIRCSTKLAIK